MKTSMNYTKNKIILINSFGPMGSSLLAAIVEKFNYGNTPVRKLKLNQYLLGQIELNSGYMQTHISKIAFNHSNEINLGGVSVIDRDCQANNLTSREKYNHLKDKFLSKSFDSISSLYFGARHFYEQCLSYKEPKNQFNHQIELTTDIRFFEPDQIYDKYNEYFDEVYVINLTRHFRDWINSLSSQSFVHQNLKNRYLFSPDKQYLNYKHYMQHIDRTNFLTLDLVDLFDDPQTKLVPKLAEYLNHKGPLPELKNDTFDLYGRLTSYEKAFTPFDAKIDFLSPKTLEIFERILEDKDRISMLEKSNLRIRYLRDMLKYRSNYL